MPTLIPFTMDNPIVVLAYGTLALACSIGALGYLLLCVVYGRDAREALQKALHQATPVAEVVKHGAPSAAMPTKEGVQQVGSVVDNQRTDVGDGEPGFPAGSK